MRADLVVVGIDPGARATGIAVLERKTLATFDLLGSTAIVRPKIAGEEIIDVPEPYLLDVVAAAVEAVRTHGADLVAVEGIRRPSWRVAGRSKPLDPSAIIGTAQVLGAIRGRSWGVPVVTVPPGRNGHLIPLNRYPEPLATNGKGSDKRRHERSAYDVAVLGSDRHRLGFGVS